MNDRRPYPERIDVARADDPRDVVHRAVACLAQGGVVALPTETSYQLAAVAWRPEAVARLGQIRSHGGQGVGHLPLALRGPEEADDWVPNLSPTARRLARRGWPGPLTLVVEGDVPRGLVRNLPAPAREAIAPGATLALCGPSHPIAREVLRLIPGPLVLAGPHGNGQPPAITADGLERLDGLDMILDDGPAHLAAPETVVRVDRDSWAIERAGALDERALTRMAGTILLFVCTGNTCRSPMAEALCKRMLAERLGCAVDDLERKGYVILSAGLAAARGHRAAHDAVEAVRARGASLAGHASRPATPELLAQVDLILTMTHEHRRALLNQIPEIVDRVRLLDPDGDDVDDPIGMDRATYLRTAQAIEGHLASLLEDLGL